MRRRKMVRGLLVVKLVVVGVAVGSLALTMMGSPDSAREGKPG